MVFSEIHYLGTSTGRLISYTDIDNKLLQGLIEIKCSALYNWKKIFPIDCA